jgi:hypothetical protein
VLASIYYHALLVLVMQGQGLLHRVCVTVNTKGLSVSLCLYSESRAQGLGDSSCIPKDRGKQLERRKEIGKKRKRRKRNEMKSLRLNLSKGDWFKQRRLNASSLLKKQRGYSQRLP